MKRNLLASLIIVVLCSAIGACGGGTTTVKAADAHTMGQELSDLQRAYEAGAITEKEYEKAKAKILKGG